MIIVYWVSLKVKFWTGMHVSSRPFEYVHSSLWGPSRVRVDSWRGFPHFLKIIDDLSRRVRIYILNNKSETFQMFKESYTLVEN